MGTSDDGFERWLEGELQHTVASQAGPRPRAAQARYSEFLQGGTTTVNLFSNLVAALGTKAAAFVAAGALVVGGGVAATAASGSPNPLNWGQLVVQQVEQCKDQEDSASGAATSPRNVGQCVSAFAKRHGASEAREHEASEAREHHKASEPRVKPAHTPEKPEVEASDKAGNENENENEANDRQENESKPAVQSGHDSGRDHRSDPRPSGEHD